MKTLLSALLMPETAPTIHDIGGLLLFFDSLSYYRPTESSPADSEKSDLFQDLCAVYAPAPLGEDLNRFNRLLHELENSRPDDLARLFASAKSPIATGEVRDKTETTSGGVLDALYTDTAQTAHIQYKERLWQARLVLKLAEFFDRREREVREGLSHISSTEKKIFSFLEGDDDTDQEDLKQSSDLEQLVRQTDFSDVHSTGTSSMLASLRLKAWSELFLIDSSPQRPFIWALTNPDCGGSILDGYENVWKKIPEKLFSLSIPSIPGLGSNEPVNKQYFLRKNKLRSTLHDQLEYFNNILIQASNQEKATGCNIQPEHIEAWEKAIKIEFPESAPCSRKLDFYCFPGTPPGVLLQKLFHLGPLGSASGQENSAAILAVLHV